MNFDEYQDNADKTAIYPREFSILYPVLGLVGEAGEVANKVKKIIRDKGNIYETETISAIADELGDVLWYMAAIATDLGLNLNTIAERNVDKLDTRRKLNTLHGSGDNR